MDRGDDRATSCDVHIKCRRRAFIFTSVIGALGAVMVVLVADSLGSRRRRVEQNRRSATTKLATISDSTSNEPSYQVSKDRLVPAGPTYFTAQGGT